MARLSHDAVRSLASKTGGSAPVVSLYLDVDGHSLSTTIERHRL